MTSPAVSLPDQGKMNSGPGYMGLIRDKCCESRSVSGNFDAVSGGDQDAAEDQPSRKKYHRHTPQQIQELENFFKECPHPDEKQRLELSRRLGLESKQIKFWFQNRRTQMKTQLERQDNVILRQENQKLRTENVVLKDSLRAPVCNSCGGPAVPGEIAYEQQQLRIKNDNLKEELARICSLANKFLGRPLSSSVSPIPQPSHVNSSNSLLAVGRNGGNSTNLPIGLDFVEGPLMKPVMGNETMYERSMFVDLALAAMDELIKMADMDSPRWIKSLDGREEILNHDEYRSIFATDAGVKRTGFVVKASRKTGLVIIDSLALVETLMDTNRWAEMFRSIVSKAMTIEVISNGTGGTRSGALQVMQAEFQVLSPLVPTRQAKFLRFCKQHSDGVWAVVDVSFDVKQENPNNEACWRLPSGCIIQDIANGYSKVTWVEHSEYDENSVHQLYRPLLCSGLGFGAQRWIASLRRQCESFATLSSAPNQAEDPTGLPTAGTKSILKLADRMTYSMYAGISASSIRKWDKLLVGNLGSDTRILTRKNLSDPGEPCGIILSAATSVWMPAAKDMLFDFLRDRNTRSRWDILSNGGLMQEMIRISKGRNEGNNVSILRADAMDRAESTMLILQETWNDASGAVIAYAPVDVSSMKVVMDGGDSAYVALLPSGFAILPDGSLGNLTDPNEPNGNSANRDADGNKGGGGCLLTVGFQILVNSLPTAKLSVESVETVNNLISCTIQKIKAAFQ